MPKGLENIKQYFFRFERFMFRTFGFLGLWDYTKTVFGLSIIPFFAFQILGTAGIAFFSWFSDWVWNPPIGAGLILSMTLINAYYGFLVAKRIKKEKFDFQKFQRTFSIMAADLLVMSIITTAIHIYSYYEPLADVLFGWYLTNKLRQIIYHMTVLKLQSGGLAKFLKVSIFNLINSKIGNSLIDSLQNDNIKTDKIIEQEQTKEEKEDEPKQN